MGISLRDHLGDIDNITFKDLPLFWEVIYHSLKDEGLEVTSEESFMEHLTDEGKIEYLNVKKKNTDWVLPIHLNRDIEHRECLSTELN